MICIFSVLYVYHTSHESNNNIGSGDIPDRSNENTKPGINILAVSWLFVSLIHDPTLTENDIPQSESSDHSAPAHSTNPATTSASFLHAASNVDASNAIFNGVSGDQNIENVNIISNIDLGMKFTYR